MYIAIVHLPIIGGCFMFCIRYSDFVEQSIYSDYTVSYMPGIKVSDMGSAKVMLNVDSKSAFVYCD